MLATDQLRREMREQRTFGGFVEPPICFAPTYKYEMAPPHPRKVANKREQRCAPRLAPRRPTPDQRPQM